MISVLRGFGFFRSWKNASGDVVVEQSIGSTTLYAEERPAYKPFELYSLLSS